mmetsp:Transcript_41292/g.36638  ORF Transcript_41292/g.36638 Transcript_41292/m.36638 type:complete len:91 (+) Transcript_41292:122-394(+)
MKRIAIKSPQVPNERKKSAPASVVTDNSLINYQRKKNYSIFPKITSDGFKSDYKHFGHYQADSFWINPVDFKHKEDKNPVNHDKENECPP